MATSFCAAADRGAGSLLITTWPRVIRLLSSGCLDRSFNRGGIADIGLRDADNGLFYIKQSPSFNDQITYVWAPG